MNIIEQIYDNYCKNDNNTDFISVLEQLERMLPREQYMAIEEQISKAQNRSDERCFRAGFKAAAHIYSVVMV